MKKITLLIFSVLLAFTSSILFSACETETDSEDNEIIEEDTLEDGSESVENGDDELQDESPDTEEHTHTFITVKENEILATCQNEGKYDVSIYCSTCNELISTETKTSRKTSHDFNIENKCEECGFCITDQTSVSDFTYVEKNNVILITGYIGTKKEIYIPAYIDRLPVEIIDDYAFEKNSVITDVFLPSTLKEIRNAAFSGCKSLVSVDLCEVETISYAAFAKCSALKEIVIPATVSELLGVSYYDGAFEKCSALERVTFLGEGFNTPLIIGENAFRHCISLTEVTLGENIKEIGAYAFYDCSSLLGIDLPDSVEFIRDFAFEICTKLIYANLGKLKEIGYSAFTGCSSLKDVVIPGTLSILSGVSYYDGVFESCTSLENVIFENGNVSLTIGERAFSHCKALSSLTLSNNVKKIDTAAFFDCPSLLKLELTESVECISDEAFKNCTSLGYVDFGTLKEFGYSAFANCSSLTEIEIPKTVTKISGVDYYDGVFENCTSLKTVIFENDGQTTPLTVSANTFRGCTSLVWVSLSDNVTEIGYAAFSGCSALDEMVIYESVITIDDRAFERCTSLSDLLIKRSSNESKRSFGEYVFDNCPLLQRIYYTGTHDDWKKIDISQYNERTLTLTPYCFSATTPPAGDWWYYNSDGKKIIWNITPEVFRAEIYSDEFYDLFCKDKPSYAENFYNELHNDADMTSFLWLWESVHIVSDPSFIFNPNDSLISKKDLYMLAMHDLLMGDVDADWQIFGKLFDTLESSEVDLVLDVAKDILGKEALKSTKLSDISNILKNMSANSIKSHVQKSFSVDAFDYFNLIVKTASNAYDALRAAAKYEAIQNMKMEYLFVIQSIAEDTGNPEDLRSAADEIYEYYSDAFEQTLVEFTLERFQEATTKDVGKLLTSKIVKCMLSGCQWLRLVNFAGSGIMAVASALEIDEFVKSYYMLKVSVYIEASLESVMQNYKSDDLLRTNAQNQAYNYMFVIDLYRRSVLLGINYSKKLLTAYVDSTVTSKEEAQQYQSLMETLEKRQQEHNKRYEEYDKTIQDMYLNYYSDNS